MVPPLLLAINRAFMLKPIDVAGSSNSLGLQRLDRGLTRHAGFGFIKEKHVAGVIVAFHVGPNRLLVQARQLRDPIVEPPHLVMHARGALLQSLELYSSQRGGDRMDAEFQAQACSIVFGVGTAFLDKFDSGSSNRNSLGFRTIARPMATR